MANKISHLSFIDLRCCYFSAVRCATQQFFSVGLRRSEPLQVLLMLQLQLLALGLMVNFVFNSAIKGKNLIKQNRFLYLKIEGRSRKKLEVN